MPIGPEVCTWWPAGAHVSDMLGNRYAVIGSAVGASEDNGIGTPEAGTLEARLTALVGPGRFVRTHGGEGLPHADVAALARRTGSAKNPTYQPLSPQSWSDFDWIAALDTVTYNRGGRALG